MEGDIITMQDLFTFDYGAGRDEQGRFKGTLVSTGLRPKFAADLHDQGVEFASRPVRPGSVVVSRRPPCCASLPLLGCRSGRRWCRSAASAVDATPASISITALATATDGVLIGRFGPEVRRPPSTPASRAKIGGTKYPVTVSPGMARQTSAAPMLVVDTSGSMGASGMTTVRSAASAFLLTRPRTSRSGLVSFAGTAGIDVAPTKDRGRVQRAVNGLKSRRRDDLYDAVALALKALAASTTAALSSSAMAATPRARPPGRRRRPRAEASTASAPKSSCFKTAEERQLRAGRFREGWRRKRCRGRQRRPLCVRRFGRRPGARLAGQLHHPAGGVGRRSSR